MPLYPLGGLYGLALLIALVLLIRRSTWASFLTISFYPVVVLLALRNAGWPRDDVFMVFSGVVPIVLVVLIKHLPELRRGEKPLF